MGNISEKEELKKTRPPMQKGVVGRVIKMVFKFYPVRTTLILVGIIFNAAVSSIPSVFMQRIIGIIESAWQSGDWASVSGDVFSNVLTLGALYVLSLATAVLFNLMAAVVTQGTLMKLREKLFNNMQKLPIKYFDTNNHGDIMSVYTNDIDAIRQMISQSIPQLLVTLIVSLTIISIMLSFSLWLTLVVLAGVAVMLFLTAKIGGGSAKFFVKQQKAIGKVEGYIEEIMNGQKVVKVFCHEEECKEAFDKINDQLYHDSRKANAYSNILGPIMNNMGNVLYVIVALAGGLFLLSGTGNVSLSGAAFSISIVVPFLNMTKQFAGNVGQVSFQINSVVMGIAGAQRIFELMDQKPETDEGYVTLVNAKEENGVISECEERTGIWAWKNKTVLHNVTIYAEPGQKVAFVGATGAGKTTITNLINRFYDIADGKIRYDGININKIKKDDLRRSLGIVLQDTNLFTGTVMDNIRYGKLDATDEECISAAKLAGADDFITRLPEGYNTSLAGNGANLSQGQRQLLAIARAAVADPPVMILDEATSSIDTRTEAIVQRGMDALMHGRTVFVIAHRLSTVKNSDVIMVLEQGRIIERGDHDKLIAEKGQYYRLYTGAFELE